MTRRAALLAVAGLLQGCIFHRSRSVRPSQGGGLYRLSFRKLRTGEPALGYGYSIESGRLPLIPVLGTYTGGPLDLQGSTEWTLENDPSGFWSVKLEPPHLQGPPRSRVSIPFDVNAVFRKARYRWPQRFRVTDEREGRWELVAEKIGPAPY